MINKRKCDKLVVRKVIRDSWDRCRAYGIDPNLAPEQLKLDKVDINQKISNNEKLYHHSLQLFKILKDNPKLTKYDFVSVLTDEEGFILHMQGTKKALNNAEKLKFVPSAKWTEDKVGTNAIGTALTLEAPVQTFAHDHFCLNFFNWSCSAFPIRDGINKTIGVVDISLNQNVIDKYFLSLVTDCGRAIEKSLAIDKEKNTLCEIILKLTEHKNIGIAVVDLEGNIRLTNNDFKEFLQYGERQGKLKIHELLKDGHPSIIEIIKSRDAEERKLVISLDNQKYLSTIHTIPSGTVIALSKKETKSIYTGGGIDLFKQIIGGSAELSKAVKLAKRASATDFNILLIGETGTGKDLFAKCIHEASYRKNKPLFSLNCAAIPKELIVSELFGYEEGTFTGALKGGKLGKFEAANNSTLFLDEIGDLPLEGQAALLRVIEDKQITALGTNQSKKVDVRIISATNKDLKTEIANGRFRLDLYYRLNEIKIVVPPLRMREHDIIVLANYFIKKFYGKEVQISKAAEKMLLDYAFPGNIRELINIIKQMLVNNDHIYLVEPQHLPLEVSGTVSERNDSGGSLQFMERNLLENILIKCRGNINCASKSLNISRRTIYRKIMKYGIQINRYRITASDNHKDFTTF